MTLTAALLFAVSMVLLFASYLNKNNNINPSTLQTTSSLQLRQLSLQRFHDPATTLERKGNQLVISADSVVSSECMVNDGLPIIHDKDPLFTKELSDGITSYKTKFDNYVMPEIVILQPSFYFKTTDPNYRLQKNFPSLSRAWNETFVVQDHESITSHNSDIWGNQGVSDSIILEGMNDESSITNLSNGNYVAFSGWYVGNYGHFVHDHASKIAWLRSIVSSDTIFLLPYHPKHEEIMIAIDEDFVKNRVKWIKYEETVYVANGSLTVMKPLSNSPFISGYPQTGTIFTEHFRRWLVESNWSEKDEQEDQGKSKGKVIFYSRNGGTTRRVLDIDLEQQLISIITNAMQSRGQDKSDLILFNGKDENGNTISIESQKNMFATANTVIGPHGSGLTNIIWMNPRCSTSTTPKVLEFASSKRTPQIQKGSIWGYYLCKFLLC